jgi:adenine deaminase
VLDDLETVTVSTVLSDGEIVVENGTPLVEPRPHSYPDSFRDSITLTPAAEQFRVPTSVGTDGRVRAIHCEGGTISSATTVEPGIEDDQFVASPERDILKITLLDRSPRGSGRGFTGFLSGFGLSEGTVATSHTWQTPGIIVVGTDGDTMRRAVQDLAEMGGGWVVRDGDSVRVSLPTPIGARCAAMDVTESAAAFDNVTTTLRELGTTTDAPALILQSIPFTGIPALRMTFSGYADIFARETVGLDPASE